MKKKVNYDPLIVDSVNPQSSSKEISHPWTIGVLGGAAASVCFLIILCLLLAVPITVFVIGTRYRDPRYCPIEPRISLFLIVHGSVALGWILLMIIISLMTMFCAYRRSSAAIFLGIILFLIIFLNLFFSLIWLIIGSVWTFNVRNRVTYQYDPINHFYPYNYCHPLLYKFTFTYLIVSYVLMAIQCCCQSITNPFRYKQST